MPTDEAHATLPVYMELLSAHLMSVFVSCADPGERAWQANLRDALGVETAQAWLRQRWFSDSNRIMFASGKVNALAGIRNGMDCKWRWTGASLSILVLRCRKLEGMHVRHQKTMIMSYRRPPYLYHTEAQSGAQCWPMSPIRRFPPWQWPLS